MAKHFFKTLVIFLVMIGFGLLGVFLVNYFDKNGESIDNKTQIAK